MIRQGWFVIFCAVMISAMGCGKAPTLPKLPEKQPAEAAPATAPTTQDLINGPYKKISLAPLPLLAQVPQSWDVKTPPGTHLAFLQGPSPDGSDIQISLEVGTPLAPDRLQNVLDRAQRAADQDKKLYRAFEIKKVGDTKIMEEQKPFSGGENSQQQLVEWKMTYFVHGDINYTAYVLDIPGLSADQLEQSHVLLQKIFDSITYDSNAAAPGG